MRYRKVSRTNESRAVDLHSRGIERDIGLTAGKLLHGQEEPLRSPPAKGQVQQQLRGEAVPSFGGIFIVDGEEDHHESQFHEAHKTADRGLQGTEPTSQCCQD